MFVGVVSLRYQHHTCCVVLITECHNSHKHSQSPLTSKACMNIPAVRLWADRVRCQPEVSMVTE